MPKFQPPMLNYEVCRAMTDKHTHKQTNKQTNKHTNKHTYRVKTEGTFFNLQGFFFFYFHLKRRFPIYCNKPEYEIAIWNGSIMQILCSQLYDRQNTDLTYCRLSVKDTDIAQQSRRRKERGKSIEKYFGKGSLNRDKGYDITR